MNHYFHPFILVLLMATTTFPAHGTELLWNTFMGGISADESISVTHDAAGNIFIVGWSYASWGTPIRAWSGNIDVFVAKLSPNGSLQWNTFLGSSNHDMATDIALDKDNNIYVSGYSNATWGTPINSHTADAPKSDGFVAKLNNSGVLQWNTFVGGADLDSAESLTIDQAGNVFAAGKSKNSWGTPIVAHGNTYWDGFVAKFNSSGLLIWNTFIGASTSSTCKAIASSASGNIYVAGETGATWGSPISPYSGGIDGFLAAYSSTGNSQWHTFFGSAEYDTVSDIAINDTNIYLSGDSEDTWGVPLVPHSGQYDTEAYAVQFDIHGNRVWNTFMGSGLDPDFGYSVALDSKTNVYITGKSGSPWGNSTTFHSGDYDTFICKLNSSGNRLTNIFLGSEESDSGRRITVDDKDKVIVVGSSHMSWGTPVQPHSGGAGHNDGFAAKLDITSPHPHLPSSCTFFVIPVTGGKSIAICL
jgi:hypothetical protein